MFAQVRYCIYLGQSRHTCATLHALLSGMESSLSSLLTCLLLMMYDPAMAKLGAHRSIEMPPQSVLQGKLEIIPGDTPLNACVTSVALVCATESAEGKQIWGQSKLHDACEVMSSVQRLPWHKYLMSSVFVAAAGSKAPSQRVQFG